MQRAVAMHAMAGLRIDYLTDIPARRALKMVFLPERFALAPPGSFLYNVYVL